MESIKGILVIKSIIFTFFIPGTVVGGIPSVLFFFFRIYINFRWFRYIGLILISIGFAFYLLSVIAFINQGKGTPMIYFMERVEIIFGREPKEFVNTILYRFSRNPMYMGVIVLTFGIGIFLESISVIVWAIIAFIGFHIVVLKLEEPHLREKYGFLYEKYCESTPRWIGFRNFKTRKT
ncbi:MAG: isoprenylcysteine carboxylmethyltransferase family protein [Promethearchaeota archaeon]|nr:MAG: isoprenylcysteine carboxylmethyltransferase family protein [Candidatus Lokiarchaeota archaeon]